VAVAAADRLLRVCSRAMLHGQSEALLPMVDGAMRAAGLPVAALDLVAASVGPGSFTGIRAGLAAARGIALAAGLPLIGVTGFEAVAASVDRDRGAAGPLLLVALESRRAELFVQLFAPDRPLGEPAAMLPAMLFEWLEARGRGSPVLVAGDAAERAALMLTDRPRTRVAQDRTPAVVGVARQALYRWRQGERHGRPEPLYLRSPDVTLPRGRVDGGA
jgi:tRNA threonylcarbamoyladenosine biosynthesis protein TsaB